MERECGRGKEAVLCEGTECVVCVQRETGERGMASRVVFALRACVLSSGMVSGVCVIVFCVQTSNMAGKRSRHESRAARQCQN